MSGVSAQVPYLGRQKCPPLLRLSNVSGPSNEDNSSRQRSHYLSLLSLPPINDLAQLRFDGQIGRDQSGSK
jgi:hypothetical protein